jgi:beta-xylosidase
VVPTAEAVATTGRGLPPAPLAAFVTFVEAPVGSPANQDHEYTTDGIRRMTAALTAVLDEQRIESGDVGERLAGLHEKADRFEAAPGGTNHVARVREVFMATADVMAAVQQQHWPEAQALKNQIGDLRTTAGALENSRALTDQTPAVRSFFRRAALALQTMSAQAP